MPSLSMMARYLSGARARRYSRRPRRLPINISSPRREWWFLLGWLKWSGRLFERLGRSAVLTSGGPLSPLWVGNFSIRLFFPSAANGNQGPPIATPQGAVLPRRGGFQK